ncbi:MAG: HEAT repeat domain-containing protein [Flammeovirgaceae bacterium]|nr:HEAT repeat domain-containing protein [Flammeovirgaceae bacterium]
MPVIVLGLILAYFKVIQSLYQEYKGKIRSKLEHTGELQDRLEIGYSEITTKLETNLQGQNPAKAVFSYKLLEKIDPSKSGIWINSLMKNNEENCKEYAQRKMNELKGLSVSENYVIRVNSDQISAGNKNILSKNDIDLILTSGGDIQKARIQRLARSVDANDRHYSAELLLHSQNKENISFLIELLSDSESKVRSAAIKTAIKKNNNEVIYSLIENLGSVQHANEAMNALILIGEPALTLLDNSFYRSGQPSAIMLRLVRSIGAIGGTRAKEMLWNKIDYPDKVIVSSSISVGRVWF